MLPNVYGSKHNSNILLKHRKSGAFEVWWSCGKKTMHRDRLYSLSLVAAATAVLRPNWLSNGVFKSAASQEARQNCSPPGPALALLIQNLHFHEIPGDLYYIKIGKAGGSCTNLLAEKLSCWGGDDLLQLHECFTVLSRRPQQLVK